MNINIKSISSKLIIGGIISVLPPLAVVGFISYTKAHDAPQQLSMDQAQGIAADLSRLTNKILQVDQFKI